MRPPLSETLIDRALERMRPASAASYIGWPGMARQFISPELTAVETFMNFRPDGVEALVGFGAVEVGRKRGVSPALAGLVAEVV